jgi:hypothetical protein
MVFTIIAILLISVIVAISIAKIANYISIVLAQCTSEQKTEASAACPNRQSNIYQSPQLPSSSTNPIPGLPGIANPTPQIVGPSHLTASPVHSGIQGGNTTPFTSSSSSIRDR